MEDRRIQIPLGCIGNVGTIRHLKETNAFKQACIEVSKMMGNPEPHSFFNLSWGAYIMYCLIVVPKELFNLPNEDDFYKRLKKENIMERFTVLKKRKTFMKDPGYHFRSLRNAISHVHYNIDSTDRFTLWDHPPGKSEKTNWHWEVFIDHKDMEPFFIKLAVATKEVYDEIKRGIRCPNCFGKNK